MHWIYFAVVDCYSLLFEGFGCFRWCGLYWVFRVLLIFGACRVWGFWVYFLLLGLSFLHCAWFCWFGFWGVVEFGFVVGFEVVCFVACICLFCLVVWWIGRLRTYFWVVRCCLCAFGFERCVC